MIVLLAASNTLPVLVPANFLPTPPVLFRVPPLVILVALAIDVSLPKAPLLAKVAAVNALTPIPNPIMAFVNCLFVSLRKFSPSAIASIGSASSLLTSKLPLANLLNSSTLTPIESASALLCRTFILLNSACPPICATTSCAAPAKSPSRANCLALLKFNCFPIIRDASISFSIEDSKSNNELAILAVVCNDKPNLRACIAALAKFCPPSLPNSANNSVFSAKSFITAPVATPSALAIPANFSNIPIEVAESCTDGKTL